MVNIAILGCGRIGYVHAQSISRIQGARIAAVCDPMPGSAQKLADQFGGAVMEVDEALTSKNVDAVLICTPTTTHFDLIHKAAANGKAIFCEKPVDLSVKRIEQCMAVVEKAGIPFLAAFNRRFDANFANLQARVQNGDIGDVELVMITSRDPSPPPVSYIESSGGLYRDMMIHDFDMARFLLGEEPIEIYATGSSLVDPEIGKAGDVDTAAVTLKTASGKICQISNSRRASYGYDQRIEVHGSRGMLRASNILENSVEMATEDGFQKAPAQHFFLERYAGAYLAEMEHFLEAIVEGTKPSPSIVDGLKAQKLADAATASSEEGRVLTV